MTNPKTLHLTSRFFLLLASLCAGSSLIALGIAVLASNERARQERYRRLDDMPAGTGVNHAR